MVRFRRSECLSGSLSRLPPLPLVDLLADLDARGLIHDSTDRDALAKRLADGPIGVYVGFDPSADSLHAGNLLGQVMLRRFQLAGHRPIALAGGATGMIGDPSGVSEERNLLDADTLAGNVAKIKVQLEQLLDFAAGPHQARLVDNATGRRSGACSTSSATSASTSRSTRWSPSESVRTRMESEDRHLLHRVQLHAAPGQRLLLALRARAVRDADGRLRPVGQHRRRHRPHPQAAGPRRRSASPGRCLLKADGTKFGKTAGGAVWLDPSARRPYQFRQFWVQVDDAEVEQQLLWFTLLPVAEIER